MMGQLKIYPYENCTVNQENQSAIREFHVGKIKIYPYETCTVKQKIQSVIHQFI